MIELTPDVVLMNRAKAFALKVHADQKYGDKPYSYHLDQVVANVKLRMANDPLLSTYVAVAWLHDTIEDCGVTYDDLQKEFGVCIADCVRRLSKNPKLGYEEYLLVCIVSAISREVKICDTMANLAESFKASSSKNPAEKAKGDKGMLKYPRQLYILTKGAL